MKTKSIRVVLLTLALALCCAGYAAADSYYYTPLATDFNVTAINDYGVVLGLKNGTPCLWSPTDGYKILNVPPYSTPLALNNYGEIIGSTDYPWGTGSHAFSYTASGGTVIFGPTYTAPFSISNTGQIVGYQYNGWAFEVFAFHQ